MGLLISFTSKSLLTSNESILFMSHVTSKIEIFRVLLKKILLGAYYSLFYHCKSRCSHPYFDSVLLPRVEHEKKLETRWIRHKNMDNLNLDYNNLHNITCTFTLLIYGLLDVRIECNA